MQCPSCGAISEQPDCCIDLDFEAIKKPEIGNEAATPIHKLNMDSSSASPTQTSPRKSTLIEFPGVTRTAIPEWRKELSERVREVQERRARETEIERERVKAAAAPPQLELLPPTDSPVINPLVAAALKRIERAHQVASSDGPNVRNVLAAAVAYAPAREDNEPEILEPVLTTPQLTLEPDVDSQVCVAVEAPPQIEKSHNLIVVLPVEETHPETKTTEAIPAPKRLIVDDPNDPALNYLDSISRTVRVDEIDSRRPAVFRRLVCAVSDLLICGVVCAPIAFAMWLTGTNLKDPRALGVLAGCVVIVTFIYLTLTIALTGRTWAMRLLSLRVIDTKTGLIPTGRQSIGRSFLYIFSLALAGLGIIAALVSREGYTTHDRLTRTAVIKT
jgi:hypothetical protein